MKERKDVNKWSNLQKHYLKIAELLGRWAGSIFSQKLVNLIT